jgi:hypothetical protein
MPGPDHDPLGRLVLRHELGTRAAGIHQITWSELAGSEPLRAGIYFVIVTRW